MPLQTPCRGASANRIGDPLTRKNLDGSPGSQTYRVREIRVGASLFRVYFHQSKVGPDTVNQIIQAVGSRLLVRAERMGRRFLLEVLLGTDYYRMVLTS